MLPEFMNLLRKFYFMRAAARSVKIKIILFDRLHVIGVTPLPTSLFRR